MNTTATLNLTTLPTETNITRHYAKDISGEVSAVEMDDNGTVVAASISLYYKEVTAENLPNMDMEPDRADWYNEEGNQDRWHILNEENYYTGE